MKNYDEATVIRSLRKKAGIDIDTIKKVITVNKESGDVGKGSWGKIDFLVHYRDYVYCVVSSPIIKKYSATQPVEGEDSPKVTKAAKRENKINMVAMTKNAMKKAKK